MNLRISVKSKVKCLLEVRFSCSPIDSGMYTRPILYRFVTLLNDWSFFNRPSDEYTTYKSGDLHMSYFPSWIILRKTRYFNGTDIWVYYTSTNSIAKLQDRYAICIYESSNQKWLLENKFQFMYKLDEFIIIIVFLINRSMLTQNLPKHQLWPINKRFVNFITNNRVCTKITNRK